MKIHLPKRTRSNMFPTWYGFGDFKDLPRRMTSNILLSGHTFNIAKNPKQIGHQHGLASIVYKFF